MINLIKENYETYKNTRVNLREKHEVRLIFFVLAATLLSMFSGKSALNVHEMMVTALTILTGFAFTALFSDHSMADARLSLPKNETQRNVIERLKLLAVNFQARSKYFIAIAIVNVCVLIVVSVDLVMPSFVSQWIAWGETIYPSYSLIIVGCISTMIRTILFIMSTLAVFIFIECLYTFYRLSETMIAIVDARRSYFRAGQ